MKEISLVGGKVTMVDDEDFENLNKFKWYACEKHNTYVVRGVLIPKEQRTTKKFKTRLQYMHRDILGCVKGDKKMVDHIDGNPLNNQKSNLRFVTPTQSSQNIHGMADHLKGAVYDKSRDKWKAEIRVNNKRMHIGRFETEQEAHAAYCAAAIKYHGEFANFKGGGEE